MAFGQIEKSGLAWRRGAMTAFVLACALTLCARADERAVKLKVAPVYPEIAKRMKIGDVVRLEVTVDPDGKVVDVNRSAAIARYRKRQKKQCANGSLCRGEPVSRRHRLELRTGAMRGLHLGAAVEALRLKRSRLLVGSMALLVLLA